MHSGRSGDVLLKMSGVTPLLACDVKKTVSLGVRLESNVTNRFDL